MDDLELEFLTRANDAYDAYESATHPIEEAVQYCVYETWTEAGRLYSRHLAGLPLDREAV